MRSPGLIRLCSIFIGLVLLGGCDAATHYGEHKDEKSLYKVLYRQLKRGDSIDKVRKLLGPGDTVSKQELDFKREFRAKLFARSPSSYPDGIQEGDLLLVYPAQISAVDLWFRDGRLINYSPEPYKTYDEAKLKSLMIRPPNPQ
jgi:hypothetical protein